MAEDNQTPEQREEARQTQLGILRSNSLKGFVIANAGRDAGKYGKVGEQATHAGYIEALSNPDEHVGSMTANAFLRAEQESGELYGGAVTPLHLLKTAEAFYFSGLDKVKVSDVLELMGSKVSDEIMPSAQREMYMEDLKESDEERYGKLMSVYASYIQTTGVGEAIAQSGRSLAGNLERILAPEE